MRRIILASESPRRSCLLQSLGLKFEIYRPQLDEDGIRGDSPWQLVEKLARAKAQAVEMNIIRGNNSCGYGGSSDKRYWVNQGMS